MKILLLLTLFIISSVQAKFLEPLNKQFSIFSKIPFVKQADYKSYTERMRSSIYSQRGRLINDLSNLVYLTGDLQGSVNALRSIEQLTRRNINQSTNNFGEAFSTQLKASLDQQYRQYNLNTPKLIIADRMDEISKSNVSKINLTAFGTYSVLPRGAIWVTLAITKLSNGQQKFFQAKGSYSNVMTKLAKKVFLYFEGNRYDSYQNPFANKKWLMPAPGHFKMMVEKNVAEMICSSQGARIPTADELQLGQASTSLAGGIDFPAHIYLHTSKNEIYYFTSETRDPSGRVQHWTGRGVTKAFYVCIKDL